MRAMHVLGAEHVQLAPAAAKLISRHMYVCGQNDKLLVLGGRVLMLHTHSHTSPGAFI